VRAEESGDLLQQAKEQPVLAAGRETNATTKHRLPESMLPQLWGNYVEINGISVICEIAVSMGVW
jgi:hypothetical protein